jgi:hypothetical protein
MSTTISALCRAAGMLIIWFQNGWDDQYVEAGGPGSPNFHKSNAVLDHRPCGGDVEPRQIQITALAGIGVLHVHHDQRADAVPHPYPCRHEGGGVMTTLNARPEAITFAPQQSAAGEEIIEGQQDALRAGYGRHFVEHPGNAGVRANQRGIRTALTTKP